MLSVVINSRNDDHGGHLLHRLGVFLESLRDWRVLLPFWELEVVLVEWNPPAGTPLLYEAVELPDFVRVYVVPAEIHNQFENAASVPFFFHLAHNVGLRRARGEYVLMTSQDVVFSERLARWLALDNFDPNCYYRSLRFDTSVEYVSGNGIMKRLAYLEANVKRVRPPKPGRIYTKACGDFVLMHRDRWHAIRGFPEWGVFGIYLDGIVVHNAYASGLRQVVLDDSMVCYHIHHHSQGMDIKGQFPGIHYDREYLPAVKRITERMQPLLANADDWGLGDCIERQVAGNVWVMEGERRRRGVELPKWK